MSPDLIVYQPQHTDKQDNQKGKWCATVIGPGGVASQLKVSKEGKLIQEVVITTTNEVVKYQDINGLEWPAMVNGRNVCFANVVYKLMARCTGSDQVLSEDKPAGVNTLLRNLINGIRLGKKSALWEPAINVKVNDLLLDSVTKAKGIGEKYNDQGQHDAYQFLSSINSLLYPGPTNQLTGNQAIDVAIQRLCNQFTLECIIENSDFDPPLYEITPRLVLSPPIKQNGVDGYPGTLYGIHIRYLSLPQFFYYLVDQVVGEYSPTQIVEGLKLPLWDYKTNKQLKEVNYQLIGFAYHIGTNNAGHYIAHIKFNAQDWYLHNDNTVERRLTEVKVLTTRRLIALYERQD